MLASFSGGGQIKCNVFYNFHVRRLHKPDAEAVDLENLLALALNLEKSSFFLEH